MTAFNVWPFLAATFVVAHMDPHVARRILLLAARPVVVMQANEFPSFSLGQTIRRQGLQKVFDSLAASCIWLELLVLVTSSGGERLVRVVGRSLRWLLRSSGRGCRLLGAINISSWQRRHETQNLWRNPQLLNLLV